MASSLLYGSISGQYKIAFFILVTLARAVMRRSGASLFVAALGSLAGLGPCQAPCLSAAPTEPSFAHHDGLGRCTGCTAVSAARSLITDAGSSRLAGVGIKTDDGPHSAGSQMVADLRSAAELLERGVLTAAEFSALKTLIFAGDAAALPSGTAPSAAAVPGTPIFAPITPFRTAGLGVRARSLADRAADTLNAKDYGARGDGSGVTPDDTHDDVTSEPWNDWTLYPFFNDRGHSAYWANSQGKFEPPRPRPFLNTDTWDSIGINLAIWTAANKRADWCGGLGPRQSAPQPRPN